MAADPYIGEIAVFGFNFAPRGWALCNGQLMAISQNTALFSLLGTTYGGNGITTFALPNLQGRVALHFGQGPGLPDYVQGQADGLVSNTLTTASLPAHTHGIATTAALPAASAVGTVDNPVGAVPAASAVSENYAAPAAANGNLAPATAALTAQAAGAASPQSIDNQSPVLSLNFCIATQGIFPARS